MISEFLPVLILMAAAYFMWSRYFSNRTPTRPTSRRSAVVRELVQTAAIAVAVFLLVPLFVLNFQVDGASMNPTLADGDRVLVNPNAYGHIKTGDLVDWLPWVDERDGVTLWSMDSPSRGDVIVFIPPEPSEQKPYIKRVIGIPGDSVRIENGFVSVNGESIDEPYLDGATTPCKLSEYCIDIVVPEGTVFVLGDNRHNSQDSRLFGVVHQDRIMGQAVILYWPFGEFGLVP